MGLLSPRPAQGVRHKTVWQELQKLEAERRARAVAEQSFSPVRRQYHAPSESEPQLELFQEH
ncbi:MAG: hypothetical protein ABI627_12120 [Polyangiaceae bacterium]